MNFLTHAYMNGNNNDVAEKIVKQMLKYWPNDYVTRTRYAHILYKKKDNMQKPWLKQKKKPRKKLST
jgi:hypothetical protein